MKNTTEYRIGTVDLRGKVDITDPCYDKDVWCRMTTDCEPGTYTGYAYETDTGVWDKRVSRISIFKNDIKWDLDEMEWIGEIGVDAGLAGFFSDKPDFPGDEWMNFLVESGVFKTKDEYDYDKDFYEVHYGVFSESGYGDGSYDVYANENRSAFTIVFISENEEDDDDWED